MKNIISFITLSIIFGALLVAVPNASAQTATAGQLIISEFRYRGLGGANDEFIEIYNASGANHTVTPTSGTGYAIVASDGTTRCTIPAGTTIPNRRHFLCTNSNGYSLSMYPSGTDFFAIGNAEYSMDIPDNAGIALFNNNSGGANYSPANRLDAVGATTVANPLYREGAGLPALVPFSVDYSFVRDECGKGGAINSFGHCFLNGPKDSNNNSEDFVFVDTNGTSAGAGQRLGAPGPQNILSPPKADQSVPKVQMNSLDPCSKPLESPNGVRNLTGDAANNSTFGTVDLRYKLTNLTGVELSRIKVRVIDLTTFPAPSGVADLRPRTSTNTTANVDPSPCGVGGTTVVPVSGTTLEQVPSQPNGGGINSSLVVNSVTNATPLANGGSVDIRVLLGVQQGGKFKVGLAIETFPGGGGGKVHYIEGFTNPNLQGIKPRLPFDFDGDYRADVAIYRPSVGEWWYRSSITGDAIGASFGSSNDKPVAGDFTGDKKADRAFFRPSTGQWFVLRSEDNSFYSAPYGQSSDIPVNGDFDGDTKKDFAVFRPSEAKWYIRSSASGETTVIAWGNSTDQPVPADYDGDRKTDVAVWRPNGAAGGEWWIRYSGGGTYIAQFGSSTDKAVAGDYTGDGRTDLAFWRPSTGQWFILRSEDQTYFAAPFGTNGDLPVPGDYDSDEEFDVAVFRPSTGTWYIRSSDTGTTTTLNFGFGSDTPLPNTVVK